LSVHTLPITADLLNDFLNLPWVLRKDDPQWIPPLRQAVLADLSGDSAFAQYARLRLFLCQRGRETVGRVAAIINPHLRDADNALVGQLGYFEAVNDSEVAASLMTAACEWLRHEGARTVLGPMNGGAHREHRFMIEGFELDAFLFEPRNPRYYPRLFSEQGFGVCSRWFSYELDLSRRGRAQLERLLEEAVEPARDFQLEVLETHDMQTLLARLHRILDSAWSGHIGYTSFSLQEFAERFTGSFALMEDGHIAMMTDAGGRDVGFVAMVPDYAQQARMLMGEDSGWAAWRGKASAPRMVWHTIATVPEVRRSGSSTMLIRHWYETTIAQGYEKALVALATEDFAWFRKVAEPTRAYALYGKRLGGSA